MYYARGVYYYLYYLRWCSVISTTEIPWAAINVWRSTGHRNLEQIATLIATMTCIREIPK